MDHTGNPLFASREAAPQQNLQIAQDRAFALAARQSAETLLWLGGNSGMMPGDFPC